MIFNTRVCISLRLILLCVSLSLHLNCVNLSYTKYWLVCCRCANGECINIIHRCNGLNDCLDSSDEKNCNNTLPSTGTYCPFIIQYLSLILDLYLLSNSIFTISEKYTYRIKINLKKIIICWMDYI